LGSLARFCKVHPDWICFASNGVFTLASGNWRMPDASLVRRSRFYYTERHKCLRLRL
jgi:hypothetical protein